MGNTPVEIRRRCASLGSPVIQILSDEAARRQLVPKCLLALSISTSGAIIGALSHISGGMRRDMGLQINRHLRYQISALRSSSPSGLPGRGGRAMAEVELVVDCRNTLGEGAVWNDADRHLWWTDIEGGLLWTYEPESGRCASSQTAERVGCFAPRRNGEGLVVAFSSGFALYDPATGWRQ